MVWPVFILFVSLLFFMHGFHDQGHKIAAANSSHEVIIPGMQKEEEGDPFFKELSWKLPLTASLIRNGLATKEGGKCSVFSWSVTTSSKSQSLVAKVKEV